MNWSDLTTSELTVLAEIVTEMHEQRRRVTGLGQPGVELANESRKLVQWITAISQALMLAVQALGADLHSVRRRMFRQAMIRVAALALDAADLVTRAAEVRR